MKSIVLCYKRHISWKLWDVLTTRLPPWDHLLIPVSCRGEAYMHLCLWPNHQLPIMEIKIFNCSLPDSIRCIYLERNMEENFWVIYKYSDRNAEANKKFYRNSNMQFRFMGTQSRLFCHFYKREHFFFTCFFSGQCCLSIWPFLVQ